MNKTRRSEVIVTSYGPNKKLDYRFAAINKQLNIKSYNKSQKNRQIRQK